MDIPHSTPVFALRAEDSELYWCVGAAVVNAALSRLFNGPRLTGNCSYKNRYDAGRYVDGEIAVVYTTGTLEELRDDRARLALLRRIAKQLVVIALVFVDREQRKVTGITNLHQVFKLVYNRNDDPGLM